ncbi:MAG: YfhO family protein [Lachnospiraceae bacterium]|nr:YfhO family protein [Lachnospiraceae bacterium]
MYHKKIVNRLKKHPKILLSILVLFTAYAVYHQYIFGNYVFLFRDIGSDTTEQYIMQYNSIVHHIRNGNFSFWDFTNGFGTSIYQMNLFTPTFWLIYLAGILFGPQVMPRCLIYIHILTILLSALAIWLFLSCFSFSAKGKIVAAYLYAFNGFLIVWGQHYQFSIILVFLPILLMLVERSFHQKHLSIGVSLWTALMILSSYYFSYMVLIITIFYIFLRILSLRKQKGCSFLNTFCKQCTSLLLGVGMGLLNLLPSYALIYNVSARINNKQSFFERCLTSFAPYPSNYYKTLLHKLLSGNLQGVGSPTAPYHGYINYYEAPNLFFSSLFLILLIQFIITFPKIKTEFRQKIVWFIAVAMGGFSLLIMFGSMIFNAFTYSFSRHTFVLMPFFALLVAYMLDYILKFQKFNLIGGIIASLIFTFVYLSSLCKASTLTFFCNAIFLYITALGMIFLLILLSRSKTKRMQTIAFTLLMLAIGLNVASDTYSSIAGRGSIKLGDDYFENLYGNDVQELLTYLHETDSTFYRMEKDYAAGSQCMDALGQYYRGISTYNSTENKNILEFVDKLLPNLYYINNAHLNFRQIVGDSGYATLLGIKYLISKNSNFPDTNYELIHQFGSLYLYKNQKYSSFAKFYTKTISSFEFESMKDTVDTEALLSQYIIMDKRKNFFSSFANIDDYAYIATNDLTIDKSSLPKIISTSNDGSLSWSVPFAAIPFLNNSSSSLKKITTVFDITANESSNIEIRTTNNASPYIATVIAGKPTSVKITFPEDVNNLYFTTHAQNLTTSISNFRFYYSTNTQYSSNAVISIDDTGNDSRLLCNASVPEEGLLFFPIPYEQGWKATIDGQKTELLRADYGFIAITLCSGEHNINLSYQHPLFKEAIIITVICWTIWFLIAIIFSTKFIKPKNIAQYSG